MIAVDTALPYPYNATTTAGGVIRFGHTRVRESSVQLTPAILPGVFWLKEGSDGFRHDQQDPKAKRYAEEPDRVEVEQLVVRFKGEHDTYEVTYQNGDWHCQCTFFQQRGLCSHTMAMERLLSPW